MERTLNETGALMQQIYPSLALLERASTSEQSAEIETNIQRQLELITKNCERLDILVQKEPVSKRRNAKYRVDQLKYDCNHLRASLNGIQQRQQARLRSEQNRAELLQRKFTPNDDTTIDLDGANAEHHSRLTGVDRQVDDLISSGAASLENLRSQQMSLKDVRRRILDVANTLGLSNTVMRFIEQRTAQDRYILFGGMATTLLIMYFLYVMIKH